MSGDRWDLDSQERAVYERVRPYVPVKQEDEFLIASYARNFVAAERMRVKILGCADAKFIPNAYLDAARGYELACVDLLDKLGLTPSSRKS